MKMKSASFLPFLIVVFTLIAISAGDADAYCSDSDGGIVYSQSGCADGLCDVCEDSYWLREYYCDGSSVTYTSYRCPGGCSNGRCLEGGTGSCYLTISGSGMSRTVTMHYNLPWTDTSNSGSLINCGNGDKHTCGGVAGSGSCTKACSYTQTGVYTVTGSINKVGYNRVSCSQTVSIEAQCSPRYMNNYRCSGDWRQREYRNSDCSTTWKNYQYCSYGCSGSQCLGAPGCTTGYLDNYRCSGDWKQRGYRYGDCHTSWLNYQYCDYGCSSGQCLQAPAKARITQFYCDGYQLGEDDRTTCTVRVDNAGRVDRAKLYVNDDNLVSTYPDGVPSSETFDFVVENIWNEHFSVAVYSFYGRDDSDGWVVRRTDNELKVEIRDDPTGEYDSRTVTFRLLAPGCIPGYLDNYRCSDNYRQREYRYSDCSTTWINYEYCQFGCQNGQCVECTPGYLDNYRCSDDWRQREYQYSDCSTTWIDYEYCDYGCSNGECVIGCIPGYLDEYQCSDDDLQRKYRKADCETEWRTVEHCTYGCFDGQCNPPPEIPCSIDVFGLDVVENGVDDIIRVKVKNTGDADQFVSYILYVNDNDIATGSFELNQSDTKVLENSYTFNSGTYKIRVEVSADCGATDTESMTHRVLEPFVCSNPNGYEGQKRCDLSNQRYLVCRSGQWEVIAENSGDYCYYCSHCGDGSLNCGETAETCLEDYGYCDYVYGCPPYGCQPRYLDQYQCRGSWSQRLYQYSNCQTEWEDWEYCEFGCSGGLCKVPCGVAITGYDYNDRVKLGEKGFFTTTFKNTGRNEELIELELFVDGVKKRSFQRSMFPGEDYTKTFEFALEKGEHRLNVFTQTDCGRMDSVSVDAVVYEREFEIIIPSEEPEEPEIKETKVEFHPLSMDIELGDSEVLYADIETKTPQNFEFTVKGLEDGWVSYPKEKWIGDKTRVFIYVTPKKPGNFKFFVSAEAETEDMMWDEAVNVYAASPKQVMFAIPAVCDGGGCDGRMVLFGIVIILVVVFFLVIVTAALRLKK